jgi:hypothetical protein
MAEADDQQTTQIGAYARAIRAWAVTFVCAHCGQETTIHQYPGYPPRYCSAACKRAVHRVRDRERKARQRAEARATESVEMSDTLPQPSDSPPPGDHTPTTSILESVSDTLAQPSDTNISSVMSASLSRQSDIPTPPAPLAAVATDDTSDSDDD